MGIVIPTDFHIFQRGWLNHQPVVVSQFPNGAQLSLSLYNAQVHGAVGLASQGRECSATVVDIIGVVDIGGYSTQAKTRGGFIYIYIHIYI